MNIADKLSLSLVTIFFLILADFGFYASTGIIYKIMFFACIVILLGLLVQIIRDS
jgi:hypothetical protein